MTELQSAVNCSGAMIRESWAACLLSRKWARRISFMIGKSVGNLIIERTSDRSSFSTFLRSLKSIIIIIIAIMFWYIYIYIYIYIRTHTHTHTIESRGARFFALPDRPWGPSSSLYNGYCLFPGDKIRPGRAAEHSPPWSWKSKAITLPTLWATTGSVTGTLYLSVYLYTGLFISPSGSSDLCGTVAGMVMPKGSMSTEGETLQVSQVFVLPYGCSICAPLVTQQMSIL